MILVWITEQTWEATVDAARATATANDDVTLLYVAPADVAEAPATALSGLMRRRPGSERDPARRIEVLSVAAADELLAAAAERLGGPARRVRRSGRVEREVVTAAQGADLIVVGRGRERRPGPKSFDRDTRFVVDHAPCAVLVVWPLPSDDSG